MRELRPNSEIDALWYALTVRHQHEWQVEQYLNASGWDTLLPSYKLIRQWTDREKEIRLPLFPGYIFCLFPAGDKTRILQAPGVITVVSFGGRPEPIEPSQIASLKQAVESGLALFPWSSWKPGDRMRIERGPLKGVEGTLVSDKGETRFILNVDLLQRAVCVELTPDMISPVNVSSPVWNVPNRNASGLATRR